MPDAAIRLWIAAPLTSKHVLDTHIPRDGAIENWLALAW